jgi:S-adenosylmethionine synthetase
VVASFQNTTSKEIEDLVRGYFGGDGYNVYANPAGDWSCGGFDADTGLTGRKLAVDNYGPHVPIGGGAFSGKDPSKVDRSGAYMARKIAVDILKKKCANEVYVWLAYAIGHDQPVEATAIIDGHIEPIKGYDLSPRGMIEQLDLLKPIYAKTAEWGHFGRNNTWDK